MSRRGQPVVKNMFSVPETVVERSRRATMQVLLGPDDDVPGFVTRRFIIEPGGRIPSHRHASIEHEQVVLEGEMTICLDDHEVPVVAGDCIFIPAGVAHWYENTSRKPVRFLCVVPLTEDYETEWLG